MNAERLLGSLLRQGLKKKRRRSSGLSAIMGGGGKAALGMGALGIAIAAFEHYAQKQKSPHSSPPPPPSGEGRSAAPPPPPPPPPPAVHDDGASSLDSEALLLIRAMVAAANADGRIDAEERSAILARLEEAGADIDEREFLRRQFERPPSIDSLLGEVKTPEQRQQLFAVSLLAIDVDTQAERDYLDYLQRRLKLESETADRLRRELGG